jgi:3-oxoacyl-[acyl-carrier-protein] synthase II
MVVVVTGIGVAAPNGVGKEQFWAALSAGHSGIARVTDFDVSKLNSQICGRVTHLDVRKYLTPLLIKRTDRFVHLGLAAAKMAIDDARINTDNLCKERAAVCIGSGLGGQAFHEEQIIAGYQKGRDRLHPLCVPKITPNSIASHISILFGFKGPNLTVSTACASGTHAIGESVRIIQKGSADVVITGGAEAPLTPFTFAAFSALQALSQRNGQPQHASRPFDKGRDGFVLSEGAAILILEELSHAIRRRARIYGQVAGYACNSGAYNIVSPEPSGSDCAVTIKKALEDAQVDPKEIDYINAHGTSTPSSDAAETKAIKKAFGEFAYNIPVSSIKSMIGHTIGAAGAIDAVAGILSITNNLIPPTINLTSPDNECDLDYVPNKARCARVNTVLSNSFGFGNNNSCIVLKRFSKGGFSDAR